MKKLTDYASNVYSQYGEDGMIEEILWRIMGRGVSGSCVEFGASDGLACSNTAKLWRHENWEALLIEGDGGSYEQALINNTEGTKATYKIGMVTPSNIDALIGVPVVDLISIDVDGDDFFIFCSMRTRAKVLLVEYNKTIPPHFDLVPEIGNQMGIGSLTLKNAAEQRGYVLLGLTESNAIFIATEYVHLFDDIEKDLSVLQPPENFMYLATDMNGNILPLGHSPPWGLVWPISKVQFRPNQDSLLAINAMGDVDRLMQGVESMAATAQHISELRSAAMQIALDMRGGYNVDLRNRIEQELGLR